MLLNISQHILAKKKTRLRIVNARAMHLCVLGKLRTDSARLHIDCRTRRTLASTKQRKCNILFGRKIESITDS